jgi:HSP20 family protein
MYLTPWNPFREMENLFARMPRIPAGSLFEGGNGETALASWAPAVDISETDKEYLVKAELPGLRKEDVKITLQNGVLSLSGERKTEKEHKDETRHRIERTYGQFSRSFTVPQDVAADKISAESQDGVICVHLPKTPVKKPEVKQIPVN